MKATRYAVIVAAGSGKRMGAPLPKQFLSVAGRPLLMHTLERLHSFDSGLILLLVLHPDYRMYWSECVVKHDFAVPHTIVAGGEERFHSVKSALDTIHEMHAIVGIHDGVRPFVSNETLQRCYEVAEARGSAVPVIAINDSLRELHGEGSRAVDRSQFRIVQTPQCFRMEMLRQSFQQPYSFAFTDDASVVEAAGFAIDLVEGNRDNIKITTPEDLQRAEWLLLQR
jgi:2-C-methyl-D-erythritol 4-phosphate cytidylyltransferase